MKIVRKLSTHEGFKALSAREMTLAQFFMGNVDDGQFLSAFPELATPAKEEGEASV